MISFNQSDRWDKVRKNWEQYAITGVKIEWLPSQRYPNGSDPYIQAIWKADTPDEFEKIGNIPDPAMAQAPGFQALNTQRPWRKFIKLKKLSKQMNVPWQDNDKYQPIDRNGLTESGTLFRFFLSNPALTEWGVFKCTWYVKMRGQSNY